MDKLVLIPSAKLIPLELQSEFGPIPSAMIPLDSRPALHYISDYYSKRGYNSLVAVHENADEVFKYCELHTEVNADVVDVGDTANLGETIFSALKSRKKYPDILAINFADTCTGDEIAKGNVVCYSEQEDVFRWTTFQLCKENKIERINEKWTEKKEGNGKQFVFIGIICFENAELFISILEKELRSHTNYEVDPYYYAVCNYFNRIGNDQKTFQAINKWWDFGHVDTYYATRKKIGINSRYYNQVSVDDKKGIVKKSSTDSETLINEIKWYLSIPAGLKYMAPRIFDYDLSLKKPYVCLEYYGYPALNDIYLYGNFDIGTWSHIFEAIENIVHDMKTYRHEPNNKAVLLSSLKTMYEKKTSERIEKIIDDDRFDFFKDDEIVVNDKKIFGLKKVLSLLPEVLKENKLYECSWFSVIHGDLCLSNILYDRRNRIVRLIDPRGGFGEYDIYGDPRYDIAKLSHSIEGDYDFIVNGLFSLDITKEYLNFKTHVQEKHLEIRKIFRKRLNKKWNVDYSQIKLIESLLFLSMVPLHADRFRSQLAFLAKGLDLFSTIATNSLPSLGSK